MNVRSTDFRVEEGDQVKLDKWPTAVESIYESKKHYQKVLGHHIELAVVGLWIDAPEARATDVG